MRLTKITLLISMIILSMSGLMFGCASVYDKMEMEVSHETITMYLNVSEDEVEEEAGEDAEEDAEELLEDETEEEEIYEENMEVTVNISHVPDRILKTISYQMTNAGIITVEELYSTNGETALKVNAARSGDTQIIIKSDEGNKEAIIDVFIIERVEELETNSNYNFAIAVGTSSSVNTAQAINFIPNTTNQKQVTYSLVNDELEGITVTEAGLVTVDQKDVETFEVLVTSISDETLTTKIRIKIIEPIEEADVVITSETKLSLLDAYIEGGGEEGGFDYSLASILLSNNTASKNQQDIVIDVDSGEIYNIVVSVDNSSAVEVEEINEIKYNLKGLNLGDATLTVRVEIVGYEYFYVSRTLPIEVEVFATSMTLNGFSSLEELIVFDTYTSSYGAELSLEVNPISAHSKEIGLFVEEEDLHKVEIRYSDGSIIPSEDINSVVLARGMELFFTATTVNSNPNPVIAEIENTVTITFTLNEKYGLASEVQTAIDLKLRQGATALEGIESLDVERTSYSDISITILPANSADSSISIEIEDSSIISVSQLSEPTDFRINGINTGITNITFTTLNGIKKVIEVEVYEAFDNVQVSMDSPAQNSNVAEIETEVGDEELSSVTDIVLAVGEGFQISSFVYPESSTVESITYVSSNTGIINITNSGYLFVASSGEATITVTFNGKQRLNDYESESSFIQKTFNIITYIPITDILLNTVQLELFEGSKLGFYDLQDSQYQLQLMVNPTNSTYNVADVTWSSSNGDYLTVDESGFIEAYVPPSVNMPNNRLTVTITASIIEFERYYSKTCTVTLKRATEVSSVTVFNIIDDYIYFDIREGIALEDFKQLEVQAYPYNATNPEIVYEYVGDYDSSGDPVFAVGENGVLTPVRAGLATLRVVARDSYIDENTYSTYKEIVVKVADGQTEESALEIKSAQDLENIDTIEELALHYVLAANIDLSASSFTSIGIIDGVTNDFTGSINGNFNYAGINRTYKLQGYNVSYSSDELINYVGFVASNNINGVIKNLELLITSFDVATENNEDGSVDYIGGIAAVNYGTLLNNKVTILLSDVEVSARNVYIGGIAGINYGTITDPTVAGDLTITQASGLSTNPIVYAGGIVGSNEYDATVTGSYTSANTSLAGEIIAENEYEGALYQQEGINAYNTLTTDTLISVESATGLAVGANYGLVDAVATDGTVKGVNNVGGLVGINLNEVINSYSASIVEGEVYIGGLIGKTTSQFVDPDTIYPSVVNNAVELYDRTDLTEDAITYVTGTNYVGGLVGYASELGEFEYNYAFSYYNRELDSHYKGDVVIELTDINKNYFIGGLVGYLESTTNNIYKNYAGVNTVVEELTAPVNIQTVFGGGLIGYVNNGLDLDHSYSKGMVNLPSANSIAGGLIGYVNGVDGTINKTYSVVTTSADIETGFIGAIHVTVEVTEINNLYLGKIVNATPLDFTAMQTEVIYIDESFDISGTSVWYMIEGMNINEGLPTLLNSRNNLLINEAPESVTVTVKDHIIEYDPADSSISFNHIKAGDSRVVVLLQDDTYDIRDIIDTLPNGSRYYVDSSDSNIISFVDVSGNDLEGSFRVLNEGTAIITVGSLLNRNISDTFEIAVIKGFDNFVLSTEQDVRSTQLSDDALLEIKKGTSEVIYSFLVNDSYEVSNNSGVNFAGSDTFFTVNNKDLDASISKTLLNIFKGEALTAGNLPVTATPYLLVKFGGDDVQVEIPELQKQFLVNVYTGATEIYADVSSAVIGLQEAAIVTVYMTTDKAGDAIDDFATAISGGPVDNYISIEEIDTDTDTENLIISTYKIYAKPRQSELEQTISIDFVADSNNDIFTNFILNITPQDLLRIDLTHFPAGEIKIGLDGLPDYYPQELPSDIIAPGQAGILKINLFPEYANVDFYEIVSSVENDKFISFEQVVLTDDGNGVYYAPVVPGPPLVLYGSILSLISNQDYEFDGSLFVKTLISSNVNEGTVFDVTVTGYRYDDAGDPQVNLSKTISLNTERLPGVSLSYKGEYNGVVARGTEVELNVLITDYEDGEVIITESIDTNEMEDYIDDNENGVYDAGIDTLLSVYNQNVRFADVSVNEDGKYILKVGPAVPAGAKINIKAEVSRTVNGIIETSESRITLDVVDFVVDDISIGHTADDSSITTMKMYVGERLKLQVLFEESRIFEYNEDWNIHLDAGEQANLQQIIDIIAQNVTIGENTASRNLSNWYQRIDDDPIVDISLQEIQYSSFSIESALIDNMDEKDFDSQTDYTITGKKISRSTSLAANIEFYYDINGQLQMIGYDTNNNAVNYPQYVFDQLNNFVINERVYNFEQDFLVNIISNSTLDNPLPIYNVDDLLNMQDGVDYILYNHSTEPIILENWIPLSVNIKSLDGNNRTIYIESFAANSDNGSYDFGLFSAISQNTVIKNLKIDIALVVENLDSIKEGQEESLGITLDNGFMSVEEFDNISFGFIAGINMGTITNCEVINSSSTSSVFELKSTSLADVTFGGLVGFNAGGYISNSRIGRVNLTNLEKKSQSGNYYPISLKASGTVAGVAGYNSGIITSSSAANIYIDNVAENIIDTFTGGFVAINVEGARISYSYSEGYDIYSRVMQQGGVNSVGNVGGFVHQNDGIITDSYSNIPVTTQGRSAGFVYENLADASINNCYSASKIIEGTNAHMPFIGTDSLDQILYEGIIETAYYLVNINYFADQYADYPAVAVSSFADEISFSGFSFIEEEKYSVWSMSTDDPNPDNDASNVRPVLPSAVNVSMSEREISQVITEGETEVSYSYVDVYTDYRKGGEANPIIVSSADQFLQALTTDVYLNDNVNDQNIKLVNDINFGEIINDTRIQDLQEIVFTGTLDGNGMQLQNVRVISSAEGLGERTSSFGMLYQIGEDDEDYNKNSLDKTVIKNINISVEEISATDAISVGVLSGNIKNSIIMNVNLIGEGITVQGRNMVGGLAGQITGDSKILNVTSNLSVSAEYRTVDTLNYKFYKEYDASTTDNLVSIEELSYAGGIAAVIDYYTVDDAGQREVILDSDFDEFEPSVQLLKVYGKAKIRSENSGGVIGYVGEYTYIKDMLFEIEFNQGVNNDNQSIIGSNLAGGLVAQNSGKLDHSRIEHETDIQLGVIDITDARLAVGAQAIFKQTANYIGGLVAYSNGGTIINSYSRVEVINENATVAGGLIGASYGGEINLAYATGHVKANTVVGGIIGTVLQFGLEDYDASGQRVGADLAITDVFALNNWQVSAFNYVDDDGDWIEYNEEDEEYVKVPDKYIGAFAGEHKYDEINDPADITAVNSFVIDEVFETLATATPEQTRNLNIVGNNTAVIDNLNVVVPNAGAGKTQFETVTDLDYNSTIQNYMSYVTDFWSIDEGRFPRLIFSDFENVYEITLEFTDSETNELGLDQLTYHQFGSFRIMNDITMTADFNPVDEFKGSLRGVEQSDGSMPTLYNFTLNSNEIDVAMFGNLESASITNFNIVVGRGAGTGVISTYVGTANSTTAILAGNVNNSSIQNINIEFDSDNNVIEGNTQYLGAFIANAENLTIANININMSNYKEVDISSIDSTGNGVDFDVMYVGGVFGKIAISEVQDINVSFNELYAEGINNVYAGGLAGLIDSVQITSLTVANEINIPIVAIGGEDTSDKTYVGGAIGYMQSDSQLYNTNSYGNIIIDENTSNESSNIVYVGGLLGFSSMSTVANCNYENTTSSAIEVINDNVAVNIGGLIGYAYDTSIDVSSAKTNITTENNTGTSIVGGLVGTYATLTKDIKYSFATGNINVSTSGQVKAGGLVGTTEGSIIGGEVLAIRESYSQVKIDITSSSTVYVGGLVGNNTIYIFDTFTISDIYVYNASTYYVGGLVGSNTSNITRAYSSSIIYAKSLNNINVQPSLGASSGIISNVYYDEAIMGISPRKITNGAQAKTTLDFLLTVMVPLSSTYWTNSFGIYPYLKNVAAPDITEGSRLNPTYVNNQTDFNNIHDEDKYYVQGADISFTAAVPNIDFEGIYVGNNYSITYNKTVTADITSVFYEIKDKALVSGVTVNANFITQNSNNDYEIAGLAHSNKGIIFRCRTDINIETPSLNLDDGKIGGLVVENNFLIENSHANVNFDVGVNSEFLADTTYIGGIAADNNVSGGISNPAINNSFATGYIECTHNSSDYLQLGGLVGKLTTGRIINSYSGIYFDPASVSEVNSRQDKGGLVGYKGFSYAIGNSYYDYFGFGTDDSSLNSVAYKYLAQTEAYEEFNNETDLDVWNTYHNYNYGMPVLMDLDYGGLSTGSGTESNPYLIHHAGRLDWIRTKLGSTAYFEQEKDIDLGLFLDKNTYFTPIGTSVASTDDRFGGTFNRFKGIYDAQNHYINRLEYVQTSGSDDHVNIGLFRMLGGAGSNADTGVYNLSLTNVNLSIDSGIDIDNEYGPFDEIVQSELSMGAIAGYVQDASIVNCIITGTIKNDNDEDYNSNNILNIGAVAGKIIGSTIDKVYSEAYVTATHGNVGGLIGSADRDGVSIDYSYIQNSGNSGSIRLEGDESLGDNARIGGIVGFASWTHLSNVANNGTITAYLSGSNDEATDIEGMGGIVGSISYGSISYCDNFAPINYTGGRNNGNETKIGGIIGYSYSSDGNSKLINEGNITVSYKETQAIVGGISGLMEGYGLDRISNSRNSGNLNVTPYSSTYSDTWLKVGGLAGAILEANKDMYLSYNEGEVYVEGGGTIMWIGGLIGNNLGGIRGSYNTGSVEFIAKYTRSSYTSRAAYIGGIAGDCVEGITTSFNSASVKGSSATTIGDEKVILYIGGLTGRFATFSSDEEITKSYNTGLVKAEIETCASSHIEAGGIVGHNFSDIENCYNQGNVIATHYEQEDWGLDYFNDTIQIGGIVGEATSFTREVDYSYNSGLIGDTREADSDDYQSVWRGAIVGDGDTRNYDNNVFILRQIMDYYQHITYGEQSVYIGSYGYEYTDGIWDASGTDDDHASQNDAMSNGKYISSMDNESSYYGWDFDSIWDIVENVSYPTLQSVTVEGALDSHMTDDKPTFNPLTDIPLSEPYEF